MDFEFARRKCVFDLEREIPYEYIGETDLVYDVRDFVTGAKGTINKSPTVFYYEYGEFNYRRRECLQKSLTNYVNIIRSKVFEHLREILTKPVTELKFYTKHFVTIDWHNPRPGYKFSPVGDFVLNIEILPFDQDQISYILSQLVRAFKEMLQLDIEIYRADSPLSFYLIDRRNIEKTEISLSIDRLFITEFSDLEILMYMKRAVNGVPLKIEESDLCAMLNDENNEHKIDINKAAVTIRKYLDAIKKEKTESSSNSGLTQWYQSLPDEVKLYAELNNDED